MEMCSQSTLIHCLENKREGIEESLGHEVDFNVSMAIEYLRSNFNLNVGEMEYLGSGNYGSAYGEKKIIGEAKVVKLTNDESEIILANELLGKNNNYLADIYGVYKIYDDYHLIIQEKLDIKDPFINEARNILIDILDEKLLCFQEIINGRKIENVLHESKKEDESLFLNEWCNDDCVDIIKSAYKAFEECKDKTGFSSDDFHLFNMGVKSNGNIGFFDQTIY